MMKSVSQTQNKCGPSAARRIPYTARDLGHPRRYDALVQVLVEDMEANLRQLAGVIETKGCQMSSDEHKASLSKIKAVYRTFKCVHSVESMICNNEQK